MFFMLYFLHFLCTLNVNFLCNGNQNRSLLTYNKVDFFPKSSVTLKHGLRFQVKLEHIPLIFFSQTWRHWTHVSSFNSIFIDFIYMQFLKKKYFYAYKKSYLLMSVWRELWLIVYLHIKKVLVFKSLSTWISIISVSTVKLFEFCTLLLCNVLFSCLPQLFCGGMGSYYFFHYYSEKITFGKFINVLSN